MYKIKDVAKKMNVSEHTLRFWAKSGFFPFIQRDSNNVRIFEDKDLYWVSMVKCLKSTGAYNKSIKKYIDLCIIGDSTIKERFEIIKKTRKKAKEKMKELKKQIEVLDRKEKYYISLIKNKENDKFNPMNEQNEFEEIFKGHINK